MPREPEDDEHEKNDARRRPTREADARVTERAATEGNDQEDETDNQQHERLREVWGSRCSVAKRVPRRFRRGIPLVDRNGARARPPHCGVLESCYASRNRATAAENSSNVAMPAGSSFQRRSASTEA